MVGVDQLEDLRDARFTIGIGPRRQIEARKSSFKILSLREKNVKFVSVFRSEVYKLETGSVRRVQLAPANDSGDIDTVVAVIKVHDKRQFRSHLQSFIGFNLHTGPTDVGGERRISR